MMRELLCRSGDLFCGRIGSGLGWTIDLFRVRDLEPFWQSGDSMSRLYLGNAFDVMSSMADESIDCVWTDPPYFLSNDGITCVAGRMVKVNKGEWDRSRGLESDHDFTRQWLAECHRILKPAGSIWVTGTVHVYLSVGMAMLELGYRILNDIQWEKPNPPPNLGRRCFTHSTETVLWATKARKGGKHRHTFNLRRYAGGERGQADEDGVDDGAAGAGREEVREAPDAEAAGADTAVPEGVDASGGGSV